MRLYATILVLLLCTLRLHSYEPAALQLQDCCGLSGGDGSTEQQAAAANALLTCVCDTLPSYEEALARVEHKTHSTGQPAFLVHQYMTPNLHHYGAYSLACTAHYCEQHGYALQLFGPEHLPPPLSPSSSQGKAQELPFAEAGQPGRDQRWTKVWLLHRTVSRLLHRQKQRKKQGQRAKSGTEEEAERERGEGEGGEGGGGAYAVWMDSDLIVLHLSLSLQRFALSFPYAHLLASADFKKEHGLINSGFLVVKVSEWSLRFLEQWWGGAEQRSSFSDQHVFSQLYDRPALRMPTAR